METATMVTSLVSLQSMPPVARPPLHRELEGTKNFTEHCTLLRKLPITVVFVQMPALSQQSMTLSYLRVVLFRMTQLRQSKQHARGGQH